MRPIVGTSTKMNLTASQAAVYFHELRPAVAAIDDVEMFVLPPFTSIGQARDLLKGSNIGWGAQDVHPRDSGAHTGDISAAMLEDLGCQYVECGHSERRRDHAEGDDLIAAKVFQIVRHGMVPVICVGEERTNSEAATLDYVTAQLGAALSAVKPGDGARVIVAYEPVWAIGEGAYAAPAAHVALVHGALQALLDQLGWRVPYASVIYGGSVDPESARSLAEVRGVDGVFVGRSALQPSNFAAIAAAFDGTETDRVPPDRRHSGRTECA
jgi:triosephosphate isomerase